MSQVVSCNVNRPDDEIRCESVVECIAAQSKFFNEINEIVSEVAVLILIGQIRVGSLSVCMVSEHVEMGRGFFP